MGACSLFLISPCADCDHKSLPAWETLPSVKLKPPWSLLKSHRVPANIGECPRAGRRHTQSS